MYSFDKRIRLPYLGTDGDGEIFEYLLLKVTIRSALISIPNWLVSRSLYSRNQIFNLHLNALSDNSNFVQLALRGSVEKVDVNLEGFPNLYRVAFEQPLKGLSLFHKSELDTLNQSELNTVFLNMMKDSLLLKSGINAYLKHLIPFFSRLLSISERNYARLKDLILEDIRLHVRQKMAKIEELYRALLERQNCNQDPLAALDLEALRELFESELNSILLKLTLEGSASDIASKAQEHFTVYSSNPYYSYLHSIKLLEQRLYSNYNGMVTIYARVASGIASEIGQG